MRVQSWMEDLNETNNQGKTNEIEIDEDHTEYQIVQNDNDDSSVLQIVVMQSDQEEIDTGNEQELVNVEFVKRVEHEEEQTVSTTPQKYADGSQHSNDVQLTSKSSKQVNLSTNTSPQKRPAESDVYEAESPKKGKTLKNATKKVALQVNECIICPAVLNDILDLTSHIHTHDILRCKVCHRGFQRFSNLKRHFLMSHSKPKPFVCDLCGLGFSFSVNLQAHAELHYSGKIKPKTKS